MKSSTSNNKELFIPLPDNESAFYAYINLIVNNNHNKYVKDPDSRPHHNIGPVKNFSYTRNEVGENFIVVYDQKSYNMIQLFIHQFGLLRTYWEDIEECIEYPTSDRYDRAQPESRRQRGRHQQ